eukprot:364910-Chlamydomonas_euryale.AAC.3
MHAVDHVDEPADGSSAGATPRHCAGVGHGPVEWCADGGTMRGGLPTVCTGTELAGISRRCADRGSPRSDTRPPDCAVGNVL